MDSETKKLLKVRERQKSKKPTFKRTDSHKKKKLDDKWRRPRGLQSKFRRHVSAKGALVKSGYGSPKAVKGLHPCGLSEVLVTNPKEVTTGLDPKTQAVRVSGTVGAKKKNEIVKRANELGLKVLN
ncbi:MAG: 50S ribosomal protein L32e [Halobacteriota archaeon]|nr:50S ribosomal protein L32e [Halobacteriota archaeon]